jgi:hypothetical protein
LELKRCISKSPSFLRWLFIEIQVQRGKQLQVYFLILFVALCAGCANQNAWFRDQTPVEQALNDLAECRFSEAKKTSGTGAQQASSSAEKVNDCMKSRGYSLVNKAAFDLAASGRAAELTKSLLAFSRKQVISLQPPDLNQIISKTKNFMARLTVTSYTSEGCWTIASNSFQNL